MFCFFFIYHTTPHNKPRLTRLLSTKKKRDQAKLRNDYDELICKIRSGLITQLLRRNNYLKKLHHPLHATQLRSYVFLNQKQARQYYGATSPLTRNEYSTRTHGSTMQAISLNETNLEILNITRQRVELTISCDTKTTSINLTTVLQRTDTVTHRHAAPAPSP